MADVNFVDRSDLVLRQIGTNSQEAMDAAAELLIEAVQEKILYGYTDVHGNPPHTEIVDTGRLFESIDAAVQRDSQNAFSVEVGADTPYAVYVHDGTYKLKGRPFITDAVLDSREKLKELLTAKLQQGFK